VPTERSDRDDVTETVKTDYVEYSGALLVCTWYIIMQSIECASKRVASAAALVTAFTLCLSKIEDETCCHILDPLWHNYDVGKPANDALLHQTDCDLSANATSYLTQSSKMVEAGCHCLGDVVLHWQLAVQMKWWNRIHIVMEPTRTEQSISLSLARFALDPNQTLVCIQLQLQVTRSAPEIDVRGTLWQAQSDLSSVVKLCNLEI